MQVLQMAFKRTYNFIKSIKRNYREYVLFAVGACVISVIVLGTAGFAGSDKNKVYAVQSEDGSGSADGTAENELQAGLMGIVTSVNMVEEYSVAANSINIENAGEDILIGTKKIKRGVMNQNLVANGIKGVADIGYYAQQTVRNHHMAAEDYYSLLQIVEAEATGGDLKSKILVANVVLNRVEDSRFPDKIYDVIWQQAGGSPQFSPTADGRIYSVTITDDTIEAVDRALEGEDYSEGALFFVARSSADPSNVEWFDGNLEPLFEHGGHEYFKFAE